MDIKQLRYFVDVCNEKSISKAAEKVYLSQQALSKSIASLEKELGIPLFIRTSKGLILTDYGAILLQNSRNILAEVDLMLMKLEACSRAMSGNIKLAIAPGVSYLLNIELLERFHSTYKNVTLSVEERNYDVCERLVLGETVDLAITSGPIDQNRFDSVFLNRYKYYALVHRDHPLAGRERMDIGDLRQQRLVAVDRKSLGSLKDLCLAEGFEADIAHITTETVTMYEMCDQHGYLGFSISFVVDRMIRHYPNLVAVPFGDQFVWDMYIILKKGKVPLDTMNLLIHYLRRIFSS